MTTKNPALLFFVVFFSFVDWDTQAFLARKLLVSRSNSGRKSRFSWNHLPTAGRKQNKRFCSRRVDVSCSSTHEKNHDDDDTNLEEEEFYKEYESMYSLNDSSDDETVEKAKRKNEDAEQRSTLASKKTKIEVSKDWDEASVRRNEKAADTAGVVNDERLPISNLSDLQRKLQQIQQRNKNGPVSGYSSEELDSNSSLSPEWEDKSQVIEGQQEETTEEESEKNLQYLHILQKARERLLELDASNSNSIYEPNIADQTMVSNMSSLQERLNQIQQDVSNKNDSNNQPLEEPIKAKYLDDETLAEWEDLDIQLQKETEKKESAPILEETIEEVSLADEAAILDALRSQRAGDIYVSNANDMDTNSRSNDGTNTLDDEINNKIPSNKKNYISEYEFTNDDGVFLSPEAYQEACNNPNPDGSLNLDINDLEKDSESQQQLSSIESALIYDEPPMAPYGDTTSSKEISIDDLTREARRSMELIRNNPEVQEEFHRRLMEELEDEEPTYDELENEALLDPGKAFAILNQDYFEKQKEQLDALEELLDKKMQELKEEEQAMNEVSRENGPYRNHNEGQPRRRGEEDEKSNRDDGNIFFASKEERINRKKIIERERRERAKNIAKLYEVGDNSSWDGTSESDEVKEMDKRQKEAIESKNAAEAKEKTQSTKFQENTQSPVVDISNYVPPSRNQQKKEESEWVFVEDPESPEDSFYWNEITNEMRWDSPKN